MAPPSRPAHALLIALSALVLSVAPAFAAVPADVSSKGTGSISSEGSIDPIGDGRFRVSGREYQMHLASSDVSGCFRGNARVTEDAVLSVPHYAGSHGGSMSLSSESGSLLIAYRGSVDRYTGRGEWWVVRGSGACADVNAQGSYVSVLRSGVDPEYRLELRGRVSEPA